MTKIPVSWAARASKFFWKNSGTQEEMDRQEGIVDRFATNIGAASAQIT